MARERPGGEGEPPCTQDTSVTGVLLKVAALAVENADLRLQSEQRRKEVEAGRQVAAGMRDLVAVINSTHRLDEVLEEALSQAIRLLGADAGGIYLREDCEGSDLITARAARGLDPEQLAARIRVGSPVTGLSVQERRPVVAFDLEATIADDIRDRLATEVADRGSYVQVLRMGGRLDPDLEDAGPPRVHSLVREYRAVVAAPLVTREETHGALSLYYHAPRVFSPEDVALAASVADQAALAIENARLREAAERRFHDLEALYRADEVLYRSLRLDDVLNALADVATGILQADKTSVLVWDEDHERLVPGAVRGFCLESVAQMSHAPGQGITGLVAQTGQPMVIQDARQDPRVNHPIVDAEGIVSLAHVPITIGREVFGVFGVNYCTPRKLTGDEVRLLSTLARKAAMAIENARLYERSQQAAALEERQRLARELHDAVTQTLFSASLIAEVVPRLWERDPAEASKRLGELRQLTRGALAEMRGLLLELRPGALTEVGLGELISQLVQATAGRTSTNLAVEMHGEPCHLPGDVQVVLYRLVQEALANVVKHARAGHAQVKLQWEADGLSLLIADDGRGFDIAYVPAGHLGLSILRERAQAIGADLNVESKAGGGTRVRIRWPSTGTSSKRPAKRRDGLSRTGSPASRAPRRQSTTGSSTRAARP